MAKMAKKAIVKYRITSAFGLRDKGEIIEALKIDVDEDSGIALLFHPKKERGESDSVELCKFDEISKAYVSLGDKTYVNLSIRAGNAIKAMIETSL